jgi:Zn finger protein HypA/HybF involved in hydrogenase expression
MEDVDLRLDGNAVAGLLREVFVSEMTAARSTCAACGAVAAVGAVHAYAEAPGAVLRCPACGAVLMRIVQGKGRYWLDVSGTRCLEFEEA